LNKFDETSPISFDGSEKTLLKAMNDQSSLTGKKWLNLRNKCIQQIVNSEKTSVEFCDILFALILKYDPDYYCQHEDFLHFLHLYSSARSDMKNVDIIINRLSKLHEKYATKEDRNETVIHHLMFITHQLINNVIEKHGSGLMVNMKNTFSEISIRSGDFEILFILWRKLFER
jgi:hypothetical protein